MQNKAGTLVIDNFNGRLSRFRDGDINSGKANFYTSWGYDTFAQSGTLQFLQAPTDISGSVITDLVMAAKARVEDSGNGYESFIYAIGSTGRVYKIQVNSASTGNPDYDNPVLLTTLAGGQTFTKGASIEFFQPSTTEYIWIGHDNGVTRLNLDGSGETAIGTTGASNWIASSPRQSVQFLGSIFYTNGPNIGQIDSTGTVVSYQKLSPSLPKNMQARALDLTADGRYLVITVTRAPVGNMLSTSPDVGTISSSNSLLVYWNGTDTGASASTSFPTFVMSAYKTFGSYEYLFGNQVGGAMIATPQRVIDVLEFESSPFPTAIGSSGDFVGWGATKYNAATGHTDLVTNLYGTIDAETPQGLYRQFQTSAALSGGDVVRVPCLISASSWQPSGSTQGYSNTPFHLYGTGKTYVSCMEYNGTTTAYRFYRYRNVTDYLGLATTGIYETQHQPFSKKVNCKEYRVYFEKPTTAYTAFTVDLIGVDGSMIPGSSCTFSPDTSTDYAWFNPSTAPTSYIGVRITNAGVVSPLIHRVEVDWETFGK